MLLLPNWRAVLRRAWSVRLIALAGFLSGAEVALPLLQGAVPIPAGYFAALSACVAAAALVARLIAQRNVEGD